MGNVQSLVAQCGENGLAGWNCDLTTAFCQDDDKASLGGRRLLYSKIFDVNRFRRPLLCRLLKSLQHRQRAAAIQMSAGRRRADQCIKVEHLRARLTIKVEANARVSLQALHKGSAAARARAKDELPVSADGIESVDHAQNRSDADTAGNEDRFFRRFIQLEIVARLVDGEDFARTKILNNPF